MLGIRSSCPMSADRTTPSSLRVSISSNSSYSASQARTRRRNHTVPQQPAGSVSGGYTMSVVLQPPAMA